MSIRAIRQELENMTQGLSKSERWLRAGVLVLVLGAYVGFVGVISYVEVGAKSVLMAFGG